MTTYRFHRADCGRDGTPCPTGEHGFCPGCRDEAEVPVWAPIGDHDEGCTAAQHHPTCAAAVLGAGPDRPCSCARTCATCGVPIAPLMPRSAVGTLAPRQWRDRLNNVAAAGPVRHEHSPTPLCGCGHSAEQATGTDLVRCGVWKCGCGDHPPLTATFAPADGSGARKGFGDHAAPKSRSRDRR
ncbi:hypothetical protein [Nocardia neocaledoniensis]|uniref:hypothetical protein n=1 Tax=Nocardia neocaledoniensis TaxID=236511 RepID=UPI002455A7B3|nr:hypothetical protein [Nocardia neocaledoniensis]